VSGACEGRYCACRRHLHPDMPTWVLDAYMPSSWAMEIIHAIYTDGRTADQITEGERVVLTAELANLAESAAEALKERA
jgi:hypothetical protein